MSQEVSGSLFWGSFKKNSVSLDLHFCPEITKAVQAASCESFHKCFAIRQFF